MSKAKLLDYESIRLLSLQLEKSVASPDSNVFKRVQALVDTQSQLSQLNCNLEQ